MVFSYDELKGVWFSGLWCVSVLVMPFVTVYGPPGLTFHASDSEKMSNKTNNTHTFFFRESDSCNWNYCCAICGLRTCEGILSSPVVWEPFQPSVVPWWRVSCAPSLPFPRVRSRGEFYLHLKMVLSSTCLLWCPDSCRLPPPQANVASRCLCAAAVKCPSPSLGGNITIILFLYMGLQKLTGWALVVHHTVVTKIGFYRPFYVCR